MAKETLAYSTELDPLAAGLAATFIQRRDLYAQQLADGSYVCVRKPLEDAHLVAHLQGEITLGAYVLDPSSQARYIVLDADEEIQMAGLARLAADLADQGVPSYLEESRRGGHLWLFFAKPVSGKDARLFGQPLLETRSLSGVELFPKQRTLTSGPGSLVRLPFGVHRKTGMRYGFFTPERQPLAKSLLSQMQMLCAPETVPDAFMHTLLPRSSSFGLERVSEGMEGLKIPLSQQIKESVSAYDFISRYVELSPSGRGLCPFHEDQRSSFSVNVESNYWYCFSGCGGGSIIDFWIKWQDCDFREAVHELADILLAPAQKAKDPGA